MYLVTAELCSGDNKVPSPSLLLDLHRDQYMVKGLLSEAAICRESNSLFHLEEINVKKKKK